MMEKALLVIDIQNDMTKNYKEIIASLNKAITWADTHGMYVIYMKHFNVSAGTRTFKPDTYGSELASDLYVVSHHIFTKTKGNVLTSEAFVDFIHTHNIQEFYIAGGDAVACVKSSTYNLLKANYKVNIIKDCITSYDKKKIPEMLAYYEKKGGRLLCLEDVLK